MKINFILIYSFAILLLGLSATAQVVSKDSIDVLKKRQENIQVDMKVNKQKIELAELEEELAKKSVDAGKKTYDAQIMANENQALAENLQKDAQNKTLANQASKSARNALRSAKAARRANEEIEDITQDINTLKGQIAEEQSASGVASVQTPQVPITSDVTQARAVTYPSPTTIAEEATISAVPEMAQKVVESTYRSYPQTPGQPTIIINNIITPNYDRTAHPPVAVTEKNVLVSDQQDRREFEDFKKWRRVYQAQRENGFDKNRNGSLASDSPAQDHIETRNGGEASERLGFRQRFGEKPPRNSGLWVIPMVGIHASNFKTDIGQGKADGRTGWNAGLDFRIHAKRFFIQPGAHYFSSSMRITSEDSISNAPLLSGPRIHSLKVPVLLGLYLTRANKGFFKMNIKAGATGTYVLAVDKNEIAQFSKENIEEYSYGLNAGLGLEFGLITLDFSHEWGMSPLFKDNSIKNNVLRATVGLKL